MTNRYVVSEEALILCSEKKKWLPCAPMCCYIEGYLANEAGPVPLVLDLRIAHDRMGSSADPSLNGHLKYSNKGILGVR